jgi:hypothetical protein
MREFWNGGVFTLPWEVLTLQWRGGALEIRLFIFLGGSAPPPPPKV